MKTLITLLMPVLFVTSFMISSRLFQAADYYSSALFTFVFLSSVTLWITALTSKKLVLR